MSEDDVFMNKELIKDECKKCLHQSLCLWVVDLLNNKKIEEAKALLDTLTYGKL